MLIMPFDLAKKVKIVAKFARKSKERGFFNAL